MWTSAERRLPWPKGGEWAFPSSRSWTLTATLTLVDYPIAANDDAIRSISLVTARIAYAVTEGLRRRAELASAAQELEMAEAAAEAGEEEAAEEEVGETLVEVDPEALARAMAGDRGPAPTNPASTEGTA